MIEIKKGSEPKELLEYRKQKFSSYADMPANVKKEVSKSGRAQEICFSCSITCPLVCNKNETFISFESDFFPLELWRESIPIA